MKKSEVVTDLPGEIWKDIEEFDNLYQISNQGRVTSTNPKYRKGERILLKGFISGRGYPCIRVRYGGKESQRAIHRLIAEAFIPNPNNLPLVNHRDNNRKNYKLNNLEWVTEGENIAHGYLIKGRKKKGWRISTLKYLQKTFKFKTAEEFLEYLEKTELQKLEINQDGEYVT